ncbi:MAG TPA: RNA polymerase sigma factor [Terriglobia bacterium]|nr:RNA polymerase sigma factor [Terriglobia bacterium]
MTRKDSRPRPAATVPAGEAELVARAQRGDEAAFAALYRAYKRRIYVLCLRMTNSVPEAEDLTQQVFLTVFRALAGFRGESSLSTWLYRVTVNEALMHRRKKRTAENVIQEPESEADGTAREYGKEDLQLAGCVDRVTLHRLIDQLPRGYRAAFVLHDVQGYEHSEIARLMKWSIGNSKSQLHRARQKLRRWLEAGPSPAKLEGAC